VRLITYNSIMSEEHTKDRIGQTRLLWRMLFVGLLALVLGAAMAYVGWHIAKQDSNFRRPIGDFEMVLLVVGALIVGPLGLGSSLAAVAGLLLRRRFRLRTLFIAISVFGVLIAKPSYLIRDYLRSWEGYGVAFPVPSFFPSAVPLTSNQWIGTLHAASGRAAAMIALAACFLPFFILTIFLRQRRDTSDNPISD